MTLTAMFSPVRLDRELLRGEGQPRAGRGGATLPFLEEAALSIPFGKAGGFSSCLHWALRRAQIRRSRRGLTAPLRSGLQPPRQEEGEEDVPTFWRLCPGHVLQSGSPGSAFHFLHPHLRAPLGLEISHPSPVLGLGPGQPPHPHRNTTALQLRTLLRPSCTSWASVL